MTELTKAQIIEYLNPPAKPAIERVDGKKELGKDAFLKLLITQMQNQDPLNPTEGVEFTSQLAQFSSLEQLSNLNTNFTGINSVLQAQNNYQAINMVGKGITALSDSMTVEDGETTGGIVALGETSADTTVRIYDEEGSLVKTLDMGILQAGQHEIEWDCRDKNGNMVDDGTYTFKITAYGVDGQEVDSTSIISGVVTGVTFDSSNQPWLLVNGLAVSMAQVMEINQPSQPTTDDTSSEV
jgi:flagellar basal-body rod modification protein FlgD